VDAHERVVCRLLRCNLSASACATRHAARWPSGRRRGHGRFQPCDRCELGAAVLAQLERSGWRRPPDSQPAEIADNAQRAAREKWVRERPGLGDGGGDLDPLRTAALMTADDPEIVPSGR
jgi:hypothetical protein